MSDDDSKKPVFFTETGKFAKGHPGLYKGKQAQPDPQTEPDNPPDSDTSFDDDLIAAAASYGRPRSKTGRRGWCEELRDTKPTEFAALLRPALERKQRETAASLPGIGQVLIQSAPRDMFIAGDEMRAVWEKMYGAEHKTDEPPPVPVLVSDNTSPVEQPAEQPALVVTATVTEFTFGGSDDAPEPSPRRPDRSRSTDMNDLLRSIPKPRFTKPRDDEPWD